MHSEIGGYIELDTYFGKMLYENEVLLNCGRNALLYLIKTKGIRTLYVPKFMCDSNDAVLEREGVKCIYYSIDLNFHPLVPQRKKGEWLYIVNYYGQLSNDYITTLGSEVIVDNAQAYFQEPISGYDTIYACRKFFGVPDGAVLCTNIKMEGLTVDESYHRMNYLLGRYERSASEFYREYVENNDNFANEPLKEMSKLTRNLLHAIDYDYVKRVRTSNFLYLHNRLKQYNMLDLRLIEGAFMYPFYVENGDVIRKKLQELKIFIPTLWPDVFNNCYENELEYNMAKNIIPLPVDQRYNEDTMEYIYNMVSRFLI